MKDAIFVNDKEWGKTFQVYLELSQIGSEETIVDSDIDFLEDITKDAKTLVPTFNELPEMTKTFKNLKSFGLGEILNEIQAKH
eukprot:snap_masked-scaffold_2-processed-gene-6.13-mRNA-1 protein AED:1.00 eAED:1.00 QI:0/-1/0/0/-1/1/1/0/82